MRIEGSFTTWYARITGADRLRFVRAVHTLAARAPRGGRVLE
jgi:hypothetical protein